MKYFFLIQIVLHIVFWQISNWKNIYENQILPPVIESVSIEYSSLISVGSKFGSNVQSN